MEYEKLLKKAVSELPESAKLTERFEVPKVKGHLEGNKTIISNFSQIANTLRRDIEHLLKYVLKEIAAPGKISGNRVIIGRKVGASEINEKIKQYAQEFVLCNECGKPDTEIIKEGGFNYLKCHACGSKHPVKSKI